MANPKRNIATEEDFGFIPAEEAVAPAPTDETFGFTPAEEAASGESMGTAMFPTMQSEKEIPFAQNVVETTQDVVTTLPQGVTTWADEIQAAAQATGKKAFGAEEPWPSIYEQDVSKIREDIGKARERSPIGTTVGEMATGIGSAFIPGLSPLTGAGKFGSGLGMVGRGAFEGLGTAEDKLGIEGAVQAGIGGTIGAGGALVSGGLKKLTTLNSGEIRANVLGARTSEFKEIGSRDREEIANHLNKLGLFKTDKLDFDVDNLKFVSKGKSLENLEKPTRKKLIERLDNATNKIKAQKEKILGKRINQPIDLDKLNENLMDSIDEFSGKGLDPEARFLDAEKIKNTIIKDIENEMERLGVDTPTVGILEEVKNRLSNELTNIGKNPLLAKTPESADIYKKMYGTINDYLKNTLKDTKYSQLNSTQSMMLTAKTDLLSAIASDDARTVQAGWGGWANKVLNETLGSPEAGLGMAKAADISNMPGLKQIQTPLRMMTEEAPFSAIRLLDPSIPEPKRNPMPPLINYTPMDMIKYRIPRSTQEIINNKDKVLAKLAQNGVGDQMVNSMAEALDGDPDDISNIMPVLISQIPNLFEKSKYNVFDGKFLDPNDRAKAADDISRRDDMNSIQRAKMISKINKNNEVPEGM